MGEDFSSKHQIRILSAKIKEQNTNIAVCFQTGLEEAFVENVSTNLRDLLSGGNIQIISDTLLIVEMRKKGQHWLE